MASILIADSGSSKTEWFFSTGDKSKKISTEGLSPYFVSAEQMVAVFSDKILKAIKEQPEQIYFYGTGLANPDNAKLIRKTLKQVFPAAKIFIDHDLLGAARALCGRNKGIACILGTGSNSCYYNGKTIVNNSPGLGFILGDEGSGSYLGKKVVQYYLYKTFDADLCLRFEAKYNTTATEILDAVYKQPLPNKYLANYTQFLVENRGHYMVENIIEDGLNDFFFNHVYKYKESWQLPINFVGSVAYGFKDVLKDLCGSYELQLGTVLKTPMPGLIQYHLQ